MASRHQRGTNVGEYLPFHVGTTTGAATANPSTQAVGTATAGGSLATGTYYVTYSYSNASGSPGQTLAAPISVGVATVSGTTNSITTTAVSPPAGSNVNWYVGTVNSANALSLVGTNNGTALVISALPGAGAATPYTINTTAPRLSLPQSAASAVATYGSATILDYGHGVYMRSCIVNTTGTTTLLTVFNGNSGNPITIACQVTPTTNVTLEYDIVLDQGLYYSMTAGTAGSFTLTVLPVPI